MRIVFAIIAAICARADQRASWRLRQLGPPQIVRGGTPRTQSVRRFESCPVAAVRDALVMARREYAAFRRVA
jgi:hypothetical protein